MTFLDEVAQSYRTDMADPSDSNDGNTNVGDTDSTAGTTGATTARADYLAVDIGPHGLRARRTGTDPEMRLDIRDLTGSPSARDLLDAVGALTAHRPPALTVWSLGGVGAAVDAATLASASPQAGRTVVVDAATATLVGALGAVEPGVVLEMTSGVQTIVTDFDTRWHRIDGWGPILGDRGSGAWLGGQGLAAALRFCDGVPGGSAPLLQAGRRAFGDERTWRTMLETLPVADVLADFAPVVGDVARRDPVAEGLCRLAGEHLADAICAGAALLPSAPMTATGGLLLIDAVKVSFASALGKRYKVLLPALGDTLEGVRTIAEHLLDGGHLSHRPPHIYMQGRNVLTA